MSETTDTDASQSLATDDTDAFRVEWRLVSDAPRLNAMTDPLPRYLLYSPQCGIQLGSAYRWTEGEEVYASAAGFHGDWGWTHFAPMPAPPAAERVSP